MLTKSTCHANIGQITLKIPLSTAPSVILQNSTELPRHADFLPAPSAPEPPFKSTPLPAGLPLPFSLATPSSIERRARKRRSPPSRSHLAGGRRAVWRTGPSFQRLRSRPIILAIWAMAVRGFSPIAAPDYGRMQQSTAAAETRLGDSRLWWFKK